MIALISPKVETIEQYDVVWVDIPRKSTHETRGIRPCIVVSNNKANTYSPIITVIPLSTKPNRLPCHYRMTKKEALSCGLRQETTIKAEGITSVAKESVRAIAGKLDDNLIQKTQHAFAQHWQVA